jgi:sucrose-6F-phosphate phosphohydrolase
VYASGRFSDSVVESILLRGLPEPDAIIGGVGTDIQLFPGGKPVEGWHETIGKNWDANRLREVLSGKPGLELQPEEFQSAFKVSYCLEDAGPEDLTGLRNRLRDAGIEASIVYSSARDLDFLPAGANKGSAAAFLVSRWGLPAGRVMVSGDSGNDRALFEQGFLGIVLENAHPELKKLQGPTIYHARQRFAGGVLEGVQYWMKRLQVQEPLGFRARPRRHMGKMPIPPYYKGGKWQNTHDKVKQSRNTLRMSSRIPTGTGHGIFRSRNSEFAS